MPCSQSRISCFIQRIVTAFILATSAGAGQAAVLGPYTADSNTLLLYHFDEVSGGSDPGNPIVNFGANGTSYNLTNTGGFDGRDNVLGNGGGYGATAFTGFGSAFDVLRSGNNTYHSGVSGSSVGGGLNIGTSFAQSNLQSASGALTYEALIKVSDITNEHQILSRDTSSGTRGFVFEIAGGILKLVSSGGGSAVNATIPTSGANAFAADTWFHVAVTYTGADGVSGNTKIYWTKVDNAATQANLIGSGTLNDMANATTDLVIGSSNRSPYRFELNAVDEVRVSDVVRTADQFIFGPVVVPSPAALPGGLALLAFAALKRRRR
ncbi:MAG: hypothetical protein GC162_07415 [Planctomycetes bacterium]|nr:hypothetical protein [Planctomycetota bacterium]